jgi:polysaccharide biosynthesis protein PelD
VGAVLVIPSLLDTGLGVVIVVGAGLVIPGQWGLLHLQPHPLWFVVLAVALRYGAPAGYGAGGLAGVSYGLLVWLRPEARFQPLGEDDLLRSYLLFATGALVGEAVRGARQRFVRMEEKYQKVAETLQEVRERYKATLDVKAELEKRIIDQPASIATLYTVAKKLTTLQASALYPAILDLVVTFLEAEACALYLQDERQLRLRAGRPEIWPGRPEVCSAETDVIGQVLAERRVVTIRDRVLAVGPALAAREAVLMAGPLLDPNGQVAGVVVVERLPYLRLTPANVQLFELILDWASTALHNAALYGQARDRTGAEDDSGAYTATPSLVS